MYIYMESQIVFYMTAGTPPERFECAAQNLTDGCEVEIFL